jgi:myosin heavy subunit
MTTMGMTDSEQSDVLQVTCAIMHIGNILFKESKSDAAEILSDDSK